MRRWDYWGLSFRTMAQAQLGLRRVCHRPGAGQTKSAAARPRLPSPTSVVRAGDMGSKTYLESEANVDGFVDQLKAQLLATVRAGKKASVQ